MNLVEGIQGERKRVEDLRKQYVAIGPSGAFALTLTIDPALKEADASIASAEAETAAGRQLQKEARQLLSHIEALEAKLKEYEDFTAPLRGVYEPGSNTAQQASGEDTPAPDPLLGLLREVGDELQRAQGKHAPMHGPHEGYAVILEELDELWDEVKAQSHDKSRMRKEALQVAAMALRFVADVCDAALAPQAVEGISIREALSDEKFMDYARKQAAAPPPGESAGEKEGAGV